MTIYVATGTAMGIVDANSSGSKDYSLRPTMMSNYGVPAERDATTRIFTLL